MYKSSGQIDDKVPGDACANVRKRAQTCAKVRKRAQTCANVRKRAQTCANVRKRAQKWGVPCVDPNGV